MYKRQVNFWPEHRLRFYGEAERVAQARSELLHQTVQRVFRFQKLPGNCSQWLFAAGEAGGAGIPNMPRRSPAAWLTARLQIWPRVTVGWSADVTSHFLQIDEAKMCQAELKAKGILFDAAGTPTEAVDNGG